MHWIWDWNLNWDWSLVQDTCFLFLAVFPSFLVEVWDMIRMDMGLMIDV